MSLTSIASVKCSHCGSCEEMTVYKSINTSLDPELKEKVKDGSLFVWECPECGSRNLAKYETLYHDPEKKLMIWLSDKEPGAEMKAIVNHTEAMGGYTLRRVTDVGTLMEKVLILDSGLDDKVVEMCKYVTKIEMAAKMGEDKAAEVMSLPIRFYRLGDKDGVRYITLSFPDNGQMVGMNIGFNVYEDCLGIIQRNPSIVETEGFAKIDSEWMGSVLA
ncbi:MAG: CpXC domain-containing protein [Bacteroidales bacterium]|nr:CpXC domain-containing protein [Bacteroidales bacterium]